MSSHQQEVTLPVPFQADTFCPCSQKVEIQISHIVSHCELQNTKNASMAHGKLCLTSRIIRVRDIFSFNSLIKAGRNITVGYFGSFLSLCVDNGGSEGWLHTRSL